MAWRLAELTEVNGPGGDVATQLTICTGSQPSRDALSHGCSDDRKFGRGISIHPPQRVYGSIQNTSGLAQYTYTHAQAVARHCNDRVRAWRASRVRRVLFFILFLKNLFI